MSQSLPAEVFDGDTTKRLSFGELSQQLNGKLRVDAREVARVIAEGAGEPEAFGKALEVLAQQCAERRSAIETNAKEQSVSVGEADLRRMKRQFSSLKNTFLHYEVKDEFIAALADGLPNGTEEIQLQQFEEEAERTIGHLRDWKTKNAVKQEEIAALIAEVDRLMVEVTQDSGKALEELREIFEEMAAFEENFDEGALDIEPGMDEEACQRVVEEESKRATELEARLIASVAELRGLEANVPEAMNEVSMMREELRGLHEAVHAAETERGQLENAQRENTERTMKSMAENGRKVAQQRARAKASAWAMESVLVLQSISGVSDVQLDGPHGDVLKLTNEVSWPTQTSKASEAVLAVHTASMMYSIELDVDVKTGHVVGGRLQPAPSESAKAAAGIVGQVTVAEIVEGLARANRSATVERVLGELRRELSAWHHRVALLDGIREGCGAVASIDSVAPDARSFACDLVGEGGHPLTRVAVQMTGCWPEEDDRFVVDGDVQNAWAAGELRTVGFDV